MDVSRKSPSSSSSELVCPSCGREFSASERFCDECRMPLVPPGEVIEEPRSEAHERARKVDPRFTRGPLVRVAGARQQPEAELIQGLLLEQGVPSVVRRSAGFDVPDFLAAGPRDILVPESGVETAREALYGARARRDLRRRGCDCAPSLGDFANRLIPADHPASTLAAPGIAFFGRRANC